MPKVSMTVNGKAVSANVDPRTLLVQYLRENLSLTGTLDATLGGTLLLGNTNSLTGFTAGDSWKLFDLTNGNITGGFTNLDYSALNLGSGLTGSLNYATGVFSISSTSIIPEPSRALLLLTGLVSLLLHRKRQA